MEGTGVRPKPLGVAWRGSWGAGAGSRGAGPLAGAEDSGSPLRATEQRTIGPWKSPGRSCPECSQPGPLWAGTTGFPRTRR